MTAMGKNKGENGRGDENDRERLRDYVAYVLTSARGLHREPQSYGPMRMVDAREKVLTILKGLGVSDKAMEEALEAIRDNRWLAGTDPEAFAKVLDGAIVQLVKVTMYTGS